MKNEPEAPSDNGIKPVSGRLSRLVDRTQKINMPAGEDAEKYWMRPMSPAEQVARGLIDPDLAARLQEDGESNPDLDEPAIEALPADSEAADEAADEALPADSEAADEAIEPTESPAAPAVKTYRAFVVSAREDGYHGEICEQTLEGLPDNDLLVRVDYSSLNYKDALVASGYPGLARGYPQVPGIDAVGIVQHSSKESVKEGAEIIVSGYELGTGVPGGFADYIRVPVNWAVPLPDGLTARESMAYGTAGFTAGLCVQRLTQAGLRPRHGRVLVTGASGGVGSFAVAILAKAGFTVTAATGKLHEADYLKELGAATVIDRQVLAADDARPMAHATWAGAVDTVGGDILCGILSQMQYGGMVACCGMAAGADLKTTVYPFILRGVSLFGVDAASCSRALRIKLWERLASEWKPDGLNRIIRICPLSALPVEIEKMLAGKQVGRTVIRLRE